MIIYQKAIKLRKQCENTKACKECKYYDNCKKSDIIFYSPMDSSILTIAKAIKQEKWKVK